MWERILNELEHENIIYKLLCTCYLFKLLMFGIVYISLPIKTMMSGQDEAKHLDNSSVLILTKFGDALDIHIILGSHVIVSLTPLR